MIRLSIIIPMYKVEPYVERCIRTIEDQDLPQNEYEIICINDGSPDGCHEVVRKLQNEYENIILLDQENRGVSMARNRGIDNASGKYLLMVDPDDYLKPKTLRSKLELMDRDGLEIGITGYVILNEEYQEVYVYDPTYKYLEILSGAEYFDKNQKGRSEIRDPHRSWAIFFRTKYLKSNNLKYLSGVPYLEDGELMVRAMCIANRVSFLNEPFYMRTTRPGSATHSKLFYSEKARSGFLKAAHYLLEFRNSECNTDKQRGIINQSIIHFTILCLAPLGLIDYIKQYKQLYLALKSGPLRKLEFTGCSDWYIRKAKHYNFSMHYFYLKWIIHRMRKSLKFRFERSF